MSSSKKKEINKTEETKNPIEAMSDFYKDCVKEADAKGNARLFKKASRTFMKIVNNTLRDLSTYDKTCRKGEITFEDLQYLDGYYLFDMGTNSVFHFHVKECPGWLFGIWWEDPEDNVDKKHKYIKGELFAQYERNIDKFKTSNSTVFCDFIINVNDDKNYDYDLAKFFNFIRTEPYLAFCRDYNGWDYNEEYHTRKQAKKQFKNYQKWYNRKEKFNKYTENKILEFYKKRILPAYFTGATIESMGGGWSPKYDIKVPIKGNEHLTTTPGFYSLRDDSDPSEVKAIWKKYDRMINRFERKSNRLNICWFESNTIDDSFYAYDKKRR